MLRPRSKKLKMSKKTASSYRVSLFRARPSMHIIVLLAWRWWRERLFDQVSFSERTHMGLASRLYHKKKDVRNLRYLHYRFLTDFDLEVDLVNGINSILGFQRNDFALSPLSEKNQDIVKNLRAIPLPRNHANSSPPLPYNNPYPPRTSSPRPSRTTQQNLPPPRPNPRPYPSIQHP